MMRFFEVRDRIEHPGRLTKLIGSIEGKIEVGDLVEASDDFAVYQVVDVEKKGGGVVIAISVMRV